MTALQNHLKNLWTLIRPVSRKEIDQINRELQAIHRQKFSSPRLEVKPSRFLKPRPRPIKYLRCATRVKQARQAMNVSQLRFGQYLGYAQTTVSAWEKGISYPNKTQLKRLSEMTGHTVKYFMDKE